MASPFHKFRKYQKSILAVGVVFLLLAWVAGDALVPSGSGAGGPGGTSNDGDVAVTWNGGSMTVGEISTQMRRLNVLRDFLRQAALLGDSQSDQPATNMQMVIDKLSVKPVASFHVGATSNEPQVVLQQILLDEARREGMQISDDTVNYYLRELTQGHVATSQLRDLAGRYNLQGRKITLLYFFEALREQLLIESYQNSYLSGWVTETPYQTWQNWKKLNDQVVIETVGVPVRRYLSQVDDPSDAELKKYFEKYKEAMPGSQVVYPNILLPSPEPAFRVPRKVTVHYLAGLHEELVDTLVDEITDEQIEQYYEQNKETRFVKPSFGMDNPFLDGGAGESTEAPSEGALEDSATEADTTGDANTEADSVSDDSAAPEESDTSASPTTGTDQDSSESVAEADNSSPSGDDSAADSEGSENSEEFTDNVEEADPQSRSTDRSPFQLVKFLQEETDDTAAVEESAAEESTEDAQASESDSTDAADSPDATTEATEDSAEAQNANSDSVTEAETAPEQEAAPESTSEDGAAAETTATEESGLPPAPEDEATEVVVEYLPLDEVRDEIRQTLAAEMVPARLGEVIPQVMEELNTAYRDYDNRRRDAELAGEDVSKVDPPELNLQELADKYGLTYSEMTPHSADELRETTVGKSIVEGGGGFPYWQYVFSPRCQLYQPLRLVDYGGAFEQMLLRTNEYIAIKVADVETYVPDLEDVRDEVVTSWKMQEARKLAKEKAESIVKQVNADDLVLAQVVKDEDDLTAETLDPFAWYELDLQNNGIVLSQPPGLEYPGNELFEKVFSLDRGQAAAEFNHSQEIAYAIRLVRHEASEDVLRERYIGQADRFFVKAIFQRDQAAQMRDELYQTLRERYDIDWEIEPTLAP